MRTLLTHVCKDKYVPRSTEQRPRQRADEGGPAPHRLQLHWLDREPLEKIRKPREILGLHPDTPQSTCDPLLPLVPPPQGSHPPPPQPITSAHPRLKGRLSPWEVGTSCGPWAPGLRPPQDVDDTPVARWALRRRVWLLEKVPSRSDGTGGSVNTKGPVLTPENRGAGLRQMGLSSFLLSPDFSQVPPSAWSTQGVLQG